MCDWGTITASAAVTLFAVGSLCAIVAVIVIPSKDSIRHAETVQKLEKLEEDIKEIKQENKKRYVLKVIQK